MKLYLAGPMSGIPQFNYPEFDGCAAYLRDAGFDIQSPAEMDDPNIRAAALASPDGSHREFQEGLEREGHQPETWGDFLSRDVKIVADEVDGIVLMDGWEKSRGARLEAFIALTTQKYVYVVPKHPGGFYQLFPAVEADIMQMIQDNTLDQGDVSYYEED